MSSTESSGAPAEATATTPAPDAAFPTFGSTRGSGLARGKRPAAGPAASTAASTEYTPTAIEVVNAPREYQNPFAPAETPASVTADQSAPAVPVAPAPAYSAPARREHVAPVVESAAPLPDDLSRDAGRATDPGLAAASNRVSGQIPGRPQQATGQEPAELNILEPAQPKVVPAQTWESEGFEPVRETRPERPRREERSERPAREERVALTETPEKFLYVRPGYTYVPTPSNFGGAPRERSERPAHGSTERALETSAPAPAKSGGFFGWLKSLFGGSSSEPTTAAPGAHGEHHREGGHRRHRGGRNRGGQGGGYSGGGEGGDRGGSPGGQRRDRGGRGRSGGGYRGERSEGSRQGGV